MSARYVLHHEGTWFYYVREARVRYAGMEVLADGEPMQSCEQDYWFAAEREAAVITVRRAVPDRVTGYSLADAAAESVRYPLTMTPDEYDRRRNLDDEEALFGLYNRVTEPGDPVTVEAPGPWLRLDGEPPPADGRAWHAALPSELRYHGEYRHLFPGYMPGFRDHMKKAVEQLPRVRYVFERTAHNHQRCDLEVTLGIPFDRPQSEHVPARNLDGSVSRRRKGRTVPVTASRTLELAAPYRIDGETRAAAAAEWDRREEQILAAVADASVTACSACHGTGYAPSGSEQHEARSTR